MRAKKRHRISVRERKSQRGRSVSQRSRNRRRKQLRKYRMMGVFDAARGEHGIPGHEIFLTSPHLGEAYMEGREYFARWSKQGWLFTYGWRLERVSRWRWNNDDPNDPILEEIKRIKHGDNHNAWVWRVGRGARDTNTPWSSPTYSLWTAMNKLEKSCER